MSTVRSFMATLVPGIATSIIAAYLYDGGAVMIATFVVITLLLYIVVGFFLGHRSLNLRFIHVKWTGFGHTTKSAIHQSKSSFDFMTVTGRTSLHRADVEAEMKERGSIDKCKFRFLLLDPDSEHLEEFCANEGSSAEQTRGKIITTTRNLMIFAKENNLDIAVRWYSDYPIWRMQIIDQTIAHVGFYATRRKGYEGPRMVLRNTRVDGLYYAYSKIFEQLWAASKDASDALEAK